MNKRIHGSIVSFSLVQDVAMLGRDVVLIIHRPSSEMFELIDDIFS
jgi:hypothetical protein